MGRKHNVSIALFDAGVDMAVPQTSKEIQTTENDKASIHLKWVAGPVGTITVEVRNGHGEGYGNAGNWYEISFGSTVAIGASDSEMQLIFTELPFTDLRIRYTPTSGNGTLTARLNMKSQGA